MDSLPRWCFGYRHDTVAAGAFNFEATGARVLVTTLCRRLDLCVPVVQAPIGSAASPELVAAVSDAGGLGMLAATWLSESGVREQIRQVRERTGRPFGVNVVLDFTVVGQLDACLALGVGIVSTFWGDPATVHERIRGGGAVHLHTVGSVDEALRAVDANVDVVVAQGWDAGGHVRGQVSTMALVPAVVDAVKPVPVIAAGGIADGRGLVAALALGAQAVWLGTRFLTATEANTHEVYRRHVIDANAGDAVYTRCFDGGWPGAPHRALRNATIDRWEAAGSPAAPHRPGEGETVAVDAGGRPHVRYEDLVPLPGMHGQVAEMALYAGQSAALVRDVQPAADIIAAIAAEAAAIARHWPGRPA
jgi:NAD(P)H-dependent flavin oxidoreductase YrpB (nitropropane dioxygenase family)